MPRRCRVALSPLVAAALLLVLGAAGAGARTAPSLRFSKLPSRALAGQPLTVGVSHAAPGALCALAVHYGATASQPGLVPKAAKAGNATWSWTIPQTVQASVARVSVGCGSSGRVSGKVLVVGSLIPPRLSVEKDGFTVRQRGQGSDASFGIILRNHSPNADARNVNVLVNFVLANDHLLGSTSRSVSLIPAGSTYALGGNLSFPGAAPIARLEIVIQVGGTVKHAGHPPAVDNVAIEPSTLDQGFVGDVAGEVINNDAHLTLQGTQFSVVVLDAAGDVLGGGNGSTFGALPPGTRMVFKLTGGGLGDISVEKAASVVVSATPTWQPPAA